MAKTEQLPERDDPLKNTNPHKHEQHEKNFVGLLRIISDPDSCFLVDRLAQVIAQSSPSMTNEKCPMSNVK